MLAVPDYGVVTGRRLTGVAMWRIQGSGQDSVCNAGSYMQVDFLPAAAMSAEDLEKQREVAVELAKRTRWVDFEFDGQPAQVSFPIANVALFRICYCIAAVLYLLPS